MDAGMQALARGGGEHFVEPERAQEPASAAHTQHGGARVIIVVGAALHVWSGSVELPMGIGHGPREEGGQDVNCGQGPHFAQLQVDECEPCHHDPQSWATGCRSLRREPYT